MPLPADSHVRGSSYQQLTAAWWQWALSMPVPPFLDPDGRICAVDQQGPVWFLAGTSGHGPVKRSCEVPEDKYLLLPVINMYRASRHAEGSQPLSRKACETLRGDAALNNDHPESAQVLIDGQRVPDVRRYRVASDCFDLHPEWKSEPGQVRPWPPATATGCCCRPCRRDGTPSVSGPITASPGWPMDAWSRASSTNSGSVESRAWLCDLRQGPDWAATRRSMCLADLGQLRRASAWPRRTGVSAPRLEARLATPGGSSTITVEP